MTTAPLLVGIAASSGTATGAVIVIPSPDHFGSMVDEAVVVCPMTTPEWVPVMQRAAAIVTDEGGMMSHAAIVCRELGIPAVVGTATATTDLEAASVVTVDGSQGHVYAAR